MTLGADPGHALWQCGELETALETPRASFRVFEVRAEAIETSATVPVYWDERGCALEDLVRVVGSHIHFDGDPDHLDGAFQALTKELRHRVQQSERPEGDGAAGGGGVVDPPRHICTCAQVEAETDVSEVSVPEQAESLTRRVLVLPPPAATEGSACLEAISEDLENAFDCYTHFHGLHPAYKSLRDDLGGLWDDIMAFVDAIQAYARDGTVTVFEDDRQPGVAENIVATVVEQTTRADEPVLRSEYDHWSGRSAYLLRDRVEPLRLDQSVRDWEAEREDGTSSADPHGHVTAGDASEAGTEPCHA